MHPVECNLLVPRRDVDPCASGKTAGGGGLDTLLEDVTRAHSIFAGELNVDAARELAVIEQSRYAAAQRSKLDRSVGDAVSNGDCRRRPWSWVTGCHRVRTNGLYGSYSGIAGECGCQLSQASWRGCQSPVCS